MRALPIAAAAVAVLISGCAASPETISCLQADRRVVVEFSGTKDRPKSKRGQPVVLKTFVQGDTAWDHGSAVLKDGGKAEIDKLIKLAEQGTRRDKRPTKISAVVITGHIDPIEYDDGLKNLDEQRAMAVRDYLVAKGISQKAMFWDGKDATERMGVTKFCDL